MKTFLSKIINSFGLEYSKNSLLNADNPNIQRIVAFLSRGNISLQNGRYITKKALQEKASNLKEYAVKNDRCHLA